MPQKSVITFFPQPLDIPRLTDTKHKGTKLDRIDPYPQNLSNLKVIKQSLPLITLTNNLPNPRQLHPWILPMHFVHFLDPPKNMNPLPDPMILFQVLLPQVYISRPGLTDTFFDLGESWPMFFGVSDVERFVDC